MRSLGLVRARVVLATLAFSLSAVIEARSCPAAPPTPSGDREVSIRTADGLEVRAAWHPADKAGGAGVVLLPMFKSDRTAWDPVLPALHERSIHVLAVDPRGLGRSAKPGPADLSSQVDSRDPSLFAAMQSDAVAAVRWLVKEGGCDAKRIAIVGAGVGGSVAVDAASRVPNEVSSVMWLSPGAKFLGLDSVAHVKALPPAMPLMFLLHRSDELIARPVLDARPSSRVRIYDEPATAEAGAERAWAFGTRMLRHLPCIDKTVASFVAVSTGARGDDVVIDGIVAESGPQADPWAHAVEIPPAAGDGSLRAYRVGRRIVFGGKAGPGFTGMAFQVQTGTPTEGVPLLGPPQGVGIDLERSVRTWSWGGMGSMPSFPGLEAETLFGKTYPTLVAVRSGDGITFEGEWTIPKFGGESPAIRLAVAFTEKAPDPPAGGMLPSYHEFAVDLPPR